MSPTRLLLVLACSLLPRLASAGLPALDPSVDATTRRQLGAAVARLEAVERRFLSTPFAALPRATPEGPDQARYLKFLTSQESFWFQEYGESGWMHRMARKAGYEGQALDFSRLEAEGCPAADQACVRAYWMNNPDLFGDLGRVSLLVTSGMGIGGSALEIMGGVAALEYAATAAGALGMASGVVVIGVGAAYLTNLVLFKGRTPDSAGALYGRHIDAATGRWIYQRWFNGYQYAFQGVVRTAFALRDARDPNLRLLARRILFMDGRFRITELCTFDSVESIFEDADDACRDTVVGRAAAWDAWWRMIQRANQVGVTREFVGGEARTRAGWGLEFSPGKLDPRFGDGRKIPAGFDGVFPSLGNLRSPAPRVRVGDAPTFGGVELSG